MSSQKGEAQRIRGKVMKLLITGGLGLIVPGLLPGLSRCYDLRLSHWREPQSPVEYEFIKCDIRNITE